MFRSMGCTNSQEKINKMVNTNSSKGEAVRAAG